MVDESSIEVGPSRVPRSESWGGGWASDALDTFPALWHPEKVPRSNDSQHSKQGVDDSNPARLSTKRKPHAIQRLAAGESPEPVSRDLGVRVARLSRWRAGALEGAERRREFETGSFRQAVIHTNFRCPRARRSGECSTRAPCAPPVTPLGTFSGCRPGPPGPRRMAPFRWSCPNLAADPRPHFGPNFFSVGPYSPTEPNFGLLGAVKSHFLKSMT